MCKPWCVTPSMWLLQELAHEEVVRSVKLEQAKEVTKLRQEVEQGAKELASKYERKMKVGSGHFPSMCIAFGGTSCAKAYALSCSPPALPIFPTYSYLFPSPCPPPQASYSTYFLGWDAFLQKRSVTVSSRNMKGATYPCIVEDVFLSMVQKHVT